MQLIGSDLLNSLNLSCLGNKFCLAEGSDTHFPKQNQSRTIQLTPVPLQSWAHEKQTPSQRKFKSNPKLESKLNEFQIKPTPKLKSRRRQVNAKSKSNSEQCNVTRTSQPSNYQVESNLCQRQATVRTKSSQRELKSNQTPRQRQATSKSSQHKQ